MLELIINSELSKFSFNGKVIEGTEAFYILTMAESNGLVFGEISHTQNPSEIKYLIYDTDFINNLIGA